jgi:hypothetical protein
LKFLQLENNLAQARQRLGLGDRKIKRRTFMVHGMLTLVGAAVGYWCCRQCRQPWLEYTVSMHAAAAPCNKYDYICNAVQQKWVLVY